jgi:hypothetical protein
MDSTTNVYDQSDLDMSKLKNILSSSNQFIYEYKRRGSYDISKFVKKIPKKLSVLICRFGYPIIGKCLLIRSGKEIQMDNILTDEKGMCMSESKNCELKSEKKNNENTKDDIILYIERYKINLWGTVSLEVEGNDLRYKWDEEGGKLLCTNIHTRLPFESLTTTPDISGCLSLKCDLFSSSPSLLFSQNKKTIHILLDIYLNFYIHEDLLSLIYEYLEFPSDVVYGFEGQKYYVYDIVNE